MSRAWLVLVLAASIASAEAQVSTVASPARLAAATDSLRKLVESGFIPSVAYSISNRTGVIEEGAFGFADVAQHVKATASTAYPVASVAKSLTAIGALRAVDAGALDLDRPANSYLGADSVTVMVGDARRLTTRALLHMTAGIPHVVRFHWSDEPRDAALDRPLGHFTAFAPGTQFYYSNQSLGIVGEILSHISGKTFTRYMADEVFRPLGMMNSAVRVADVRARGPCSGVSRSSPSRVGLHATGSRTRSGHVHQCARSGSARKARDSAA